MSPRADLFIWLPLSGIEILFPGHPARSPGIAYTYFSYVLFKYFFLKLALRRRPLLCIVHLDMRSKRGDSRRSWLPVENGRLVKGDLIITSKGKVGLEKCKRCI